MSLSNSNKNRLTCHGCRQHINEKSLLKAGENTSWHQFCLRCCVCGKSLYEGSGRSTCLMRNGKPYCKDDYKREYSVRCSGCDMVLHANDLVMRTTTKVYHTHCFRCKICLKVLLPGTQFKLKDNEMIVCPNHSTSFPENGRSKESVSHDADNIEAPEHERIAKNKRKLSSNRQRVRTVLTEKQLATLKACYTANPRPDAIMKEKLVELTGLPSRVIRVWFQNKRCKDKKRSITGIVLENTSSACLPFTPTTTESFHYDRGNPFIGHWNSDYSWFNQLDAYLNTNSRL